MKKIIGIIVIILMIPVIISIIGDIDRTPVYPTTEFNIIDKPTDKQLLSNDKLLYQLPNTIDITTNELPEYVEYYEYGTLEVDSGILNYTIIDNLAYINYIEGEPTQVVDGEFIVSKPTQIISKSSNLLSKQEMLSQPSITETIHLGELVYSIPQGSNVNDIKILQGQFKPNTQYTIKFDYARSGIINNTDLRFVYTDNSSSIIPINYNTEFSTFVATSDVGKTLSHISFNNRTEARIVNIKQSTLQLNEGTEALPYEPYAEHIYPLDNGINLYKLPNGVGDIWLQDGTLEQNVGIIDTVDNYAEFGTLPTGTYDNILEFINNNQNKQIKIFFDDNIQESRYNTYLENDTIIINNDIEVIRIYNNDTYTSTLNLDTNITYKLEGYNIIDYIDGEFDNTVLAFFWIIPVLLTGGLIYLLLKRKE